MSALISKLRTNGSAKGKGPPPLENNPILEFFEVGPVFTSAGPELMWHIHEAHRKSDGKECSVFVLDKRVVDKLYRSSVKQRDSMLERVQSTIAQLDRIRHPKMVQVLHSLVEGQNTLAFASEPVIGSLHNILSWNSAAAVAPGSNPTSPTQKHKEPLPHSPPPRNYTFLDIELRYGIMQIIEALSFVHYQLGLVHRNVCPHVIIVTKRGTWKLFGLEFAESICSGSDPTDMIPVPPWSVKVARISQPCLDFLAPEVQTKGQCNILSDMFSLGLVICSLFNKGRFLIQANNNPNLYLRQIENLNQLIQGIFPRVPAPLREAITRLLNKDPHPRPTTQLLPLIKYFKCPSEVAVHAMQFIDVIAYKDPKSKAHFYRSTLIDALPYIPRKLRWQHVWPALQAEVCVPEVLTAALQPILWLTNDATSDDFSTYVLPLFKNLMNSPRTVQACVTVLENLHIILKKCKPDEVNNDVLPLMFTALANNSIQIQTAALISMLNVTDFIDDKRMYMFAFPRVRTVLDKHQGDVKIVSLCLAFYEKVLPRMERAHAIEQLLPTLIAMKLGNPIVISRVVSLYKTLILEPRFGLTTTVMANNMIPSLAPQTVNPALTIEQFTALMEIIYNMLDNIDKNQRYKMSLAIGSPERRALRYQLSNDNVVAPPFNIPNLRVEQRKTSSAEDMARKNSVCSNTASAGGSTATVQGSGFRNTGLGQWIFGLNNPANADNNFLRVSSVLPNRRLSDNTLMTPKIRIAPSCASSPGGSPGGASGLPSRRHSSIGPQERRASAVNLSPPTGYPYRGRGGSGSSLSVPTTSHCVGGSMPNTSSSVPFLLNSSMQSIKSRRPSACSSQGSGLLHQLSSGMVRHMQRGSVAQRNPGWSLQGATSAGLNAISQQTSMAVRKCPSLNISLR